MTWGAHRSLYVPGSPRDAAPLSASTTMPAALHPSSCPSFCVGLGSRVCSPSSCWADTGDALGPGGLTPVIGVNHRKKPCLSRKCFSAAGADTDSGAPGTGTRPRRPPCPLPACAHLLSVSPPSRGVFALALLARSAYPTPPPACAPGAALPSACWGEQGLLACEL